MQVVEQQVQRPTILTHRQQDTLKGWLHTVRKKTSRFSTRITASLGLISLTRDEEFDRHYHSFKHVEKTIRTFIKNLSAFVEHFENFLLALQNTSENLSDFYRDKTHHQRELEEMRRKNKALASEHFHAFKRTIDRQVISVSSQLLQKFSGPHQLIHKRSTKLLDYDCKTRELESCRDVNKKTILREQHVIAKELYEKINKQLIDELPVFNRFALDIFRDCILVLLESRRNLIIAYTKQTAGLLDTPLMMTYTASDVAASILMSCDANRSLSMGQDSDQADEMICRVQRDSGQTSANDSRHNNDEFSRPQSVNSRLSSEFDRLGIVSREISSTPLSQVSDTQLDKGGQVNFDVPDGKLDISNEMNSDTKPQVDRETDEKVISDSGVQSLKRAASKEPRKKKRFPIYIASWPFVSTGPNQLSISCNQPLKLIKGCDECGNSDWSLVQNKKGQLGYVPTSYIKKKE